MSYFKLVLPWINLLSLFFLVDCVLLHHHKNLPVHARTALTGEPLEGFIKRRIAAHLFFSVGFYGSTLSRNLPLPEQWRFLVSLTGLGFLFIAMILSIQNNRHYLKRWTSTL